MNFYLTLASASASKPKSQLQLYVWSNHSLFFMQGKHTTGDIYDYSNGNKYTYIRYERHQVIMTLGLMI